MMTTRRGSSGVGVDGGDVGADAGDGGASIGGRGNFGDGGGAALGRFSSFQVRKSDSRDLNFAQRVLIGGMAAIGSDGVCLGLRGAD